MKHQTPLSAIRSKCLECCVGATKEIRECEIEDCALHPFRMGTRPKGVRGVNMPDRGPLREGGVLQKNHKLAGL
jgi:hypothetical protein